MDSATIAGYGYSNAEAGTVGKFNVSWPEPPLSHGVSQFKFFPGKGVRGKSTFCQGDSGGPLLVGWNRGCHRTDKVRGLRPRYLQGVISYDERRQLDNATALEEAQACMDAKTMAMQDITTKERRVWICETTAYEAGGC